MSPAAITNSAAKHTPSARRGRVHRTRPNQLNIREFGFESLRARCIRRMWSGSTQAGGALEVTPPVGSEHGGVRGSSSAVRGETTTEPVLAALQGMAAASEPVALLLVDDAASDFLTRAHEIASTGKARAAGRSRLLVDESGSAGHDARARRLSHRAAMGGRRGDVPRYERVPPRGRGSRSRASSCFGSLPRRVTAECCSCAT
jgi:hypothetical protein